jgi:hypothetical protein
MSSRKLKYGIHVFAATPTLGDLLQSLPSVRHALFIAGVPEKFVAHRYRVDPDLTLLERQGGRKLLRFGSSGLSDAFGIDLATGNVIEEINARGFPLVFVNTSIDKFVLTTQLVAGRFPYYGQKATEGEMEFAAADLRDIIRDIDLPAMVADRFWSTFADDVENGDMSTEEILAVGWDAS